MLENLISEERRLCVYDVNVVQYKTSENK